MAKINALRLVGIPYSDSDATTALAQLERQAQDMAAALRDQGESVDPASEIIAMIAYLQRLGIDFKKLSRTAGGQP